MRTRSSSLADECSFPLFGASCQNLFINSYSRVSDTNCCHSQREEFRSAHFTNICCLSITRPVCQGLYIKSCAGKVFLLLDYPSTSFNLSTYAEVNVVLMRRGTYKPDPSISPIHLMNVQRHSPSLLTSLSGRWLDRLTRVCREDG